MSLTINLDRMKLNKFIPTELDILRKLIHAGIDPSQHQVAYRQGWLFLKASGGNPAFKVGLLPWTNLIEDGYANFFAGIVYFHNNLTSYPFFCEISKGDFGVSFTGFRVSNSNLYFVDNGTTTSVNLGAVNAGETWLLLLGVWNDGGTKKVIYWAGKWDYETDSCTEVGSNLTGIETTESAYFKECQFLEPDGTAFEGGVAGWVKQKRRSAGVDNIYVEIERLMLQLRAHGLPRPQDVYPF